MKTSILNLVLFAALAAPNGAFASCACGDLNADGRVTVTDAMIMLHLATGRVPKGIRTATPADELVAYVDPVTGELVDSPPDGGAVVPGDVIEPGDLEGMVAYVDPETGELLEERPEDSDLVGDVMTPSCLVLAPQY